MILFVSSYALYSLCPVDCTVNRMNFGSGFGPFILAGFIGVVQLSGITWKIIPAFSRICQLLLAGAPVKEQRANVTELVKKLCSVAMVKHFKLLIANFVSLKSKIKSLPYSRVHQSFTT